MTNTRNGNRGEGSDPPNPPPITELLGQMTQVVAQMAAYQATQNNQGNRNEGNARVSIKDFLSLGPRTFSSPKEPLDADDWLREMNRTLDITHAAEQDKVPYVSYLLRG